MEEKKAHPRNVQAVIDWYRKNKTPNDVAQIERLFDPPPGPASVMQLVCEALVLQGFEAGRDFQREHPDVEPGIGYLPQPAAGKCNDEHASGLLCTQAAGHLGRHNGSGLSW